MRPLLLTILFVCVGACGSSSPVQPEFANLHGRRLHDRPIEETSDALQRIWPQVRDALASDWPAPDSESAADYRTWLGAQMLPRMRARSRLIQELLPALGTLSRGSGADQLFAAVVEALLLDDLIQRFDSFPVPPAIESDPGLLATYNQELDAILRPVGARARAAYGRCVRLSSNVGADLTDWGTTCTEGSLALRQRFPPPRVEGG